jgi:hypothetical protein
MHSLSKTIVAVAAMAASIPQAAWSTQYGPNGPRMLPYILDSGWDVINDTCNGVPRPPGPTIFYCNNGQWTQQPDYPVQPSGSGITIDSEYDW